MIAKVVYILCALTSLLCAVLLYRQFSKTRLQLLFWSFLCFAGLATGNILLFLDLVILPEIDLSAYRLLASLTGIILLIWGLIWETI